MQTFKLLTPVKDAHGAEVTEVTVDEPTVKEIIKLGEDSKKHGGAMAMVLMISGQTGLDAFTVQKLKARDYKILSGFFERFFTDSDPSNSES